MGSKQFITLQHLALFIAWLFHVSGAIGILGTPYKAWFIQNTPLTLLLMAVLLVLTQTPKNGAFFLYIALSFAVGYAAEWVGVHTGWLFGQYSYGTVLGPKADGIPLLIGINWFTITYCAGMVTTRLHRWSSRVLARIGAPPLPRAIQAASFITDGALMAMLFDYVMEPVAVKLGYWQWLGDGSIPLYNYVCWLLISAGLLGLFRVLPFKKDNQLAVHLFIIQFLFFLLLSVFL